MTAPLTRLPDGGETSKLPSYPKCHKVVVSEMMVSAEVAQSGDHPAVGRPPEIEEPANLLLIHPLSRRLVSWLINSAVTPNQVSMTSVLAAGAAAVSFVSLPKIVGFVVGLGCLVLWHILDGADGDLARRTGRASPKGELIDGVCDHISQALIYAAVAIVLRRSLGDIAWAFAALAAVSHTFQAAAYEAGRKTYRRWVYGALWMKQQPNLTPSLAGFANRSYLRLADLLSPGEPMVERTMENATSKGGGPEAAATYRKRFEGLVKASGLLGATSRSLGVAISLLAARPLWFFLYEIVILNAATIVFVALRWRANKTLAKALSSLGSKLKSCETGI